MTVYYVQGVLRRGGIWEMNEQEKTVEILREYQLFRRREDVQPHMSYAHEKIRHRIISEGRVEELEKMTMMPPPDGTVGILSRDELRHWKNMFIASITLFTRAAMDGGLAEEIAYAMSDSYIQSVEDCTCFQEIDYLYQKALRAFTEAVARKGKRHYSTVIEGVIHYIHIHLHEKITLEMVSEQASLSPCYLSRLFKQETGVSIVDYIQRERVEAARNMLIYSEYSVSAISEYLHFSTQSYFIKIFRKYMGMTPARYRKYYREKEEW